MSLEFYDTDDVARMLRCETKTVLRMVRSGELRGARFGKTYVFSPDAIRSAYEARVSTAPEAGPPDLP